MDKLDHFIPNLTYTALTYPFRNSGILGFGLQRNCSSLLVTNSMIKQWKESVMRGPN